MIKSDPKLSSTEEATPKYKLNWLPWRSGIAFVDHGRTLLVIKETENEDPPISEDGPMDSQVHIHMYIYVCIHVHNSILLLSPFLSLSLLSLFPFLSLMLVCYTHIFHVHVCKCMYMYMYIQCTCTRKKLEPDKPAVPGQHCFEFVSSHDTYMYMHKNVYTCTYLYYTEWQYSIYM